MELSTVAGAETWRGWSWPRAGAQGRDTLASLLRPSWLPAGSFMGCWSWKPTNRGPRKHDLCALGQSLNLSEPQFLHLLKGPITLTLQVCGKGQR